MNVLASPVGIARASTPLTRPLRILHVIPAYYPATRYGGTVSALRGLCAALVRRGHEVHIYTTSIDGPNDLDVPLRQAVMLDGAAVHYFPIAALRRLCWSPAMAAALRGTIHTFDVVHLHSIFLWPTWAAARGARHAGVPYIVSPHGMLVGDLIRRKSRWVKTAWIRLIERRTLQDAAVMHVTADLEASEAAALGLPLPEIHKVSHGVDWPSFHAPLAAGPYANLAKPYALFLGRINWKKGLDRLIRAWPLVPELRLVIAGNDEEGYLSELKALAQREGVEDRVSFVGFAQDPDKWALYENAEMFVLPSHNENFGCAVAEAMAMACPVVVTPNVGIAQLVLETGSGVVAAGEPEALAKAIRDLHQDQARRRALGEQAGRTALRYLSWDAAAEGMEAVYRQAASAGGRMTEATPAQVSS
jgi:glycosyltransferase involved in cell wall biosynthesis